MKSETMAQTRFNRDGRVATARSRCAIRQGALFGVQPKSAALFSRLRSRFLQRAFKKFTSSIWRPLFLSVLRRCISKTQEPYGRILTFFVTSTRGQGMVHDPQLSAAYRAIRSCSYWSDPSGQSTSSAIFRKCSNLFARSSISFVTGSSI